MLDIGQDQNIAETIRCHPAKNDWTINPFAIFYLAGSTKEIRVACTPDYADKVKALHHHGDVRVLLVLPMGSSEVGKIRKKLLNANPLGDQSYEMEKFVRSAQSVPGKLRKLILDDRYWYEGFFQGTPRLLGTNPRAMGTNPRAMGTNPIAMGTNPIAMGTNPNAMKARTA